MLLRSGLQRIALSPLNGITRVVEWLQATADLLQATADSLPYYPALSDTKDASALQVAVLLIFCDSRL